MFFTRLIVTHVSILTSETSLIPLGVAPFSGIWNVPLLTRLVRHYLDQIDYVSYLCAFTWVYIKSPLRPYTVEFLVAEPVAESVNPVAGEQGFKNKSRSMKQLFMFIKFFLDEL